MNRETYKEIFERYPIGDTPALEIGAWSNPWLIGSQITYMDRESNFSIRQVVHDLEDLPLPFSNGQFKIIALREVLEHVCPKNQVPVMRELRRLLTDKGVIMLTVPFYQYESAHSTPDHCKYFTKNSFNQYLEETYNGKGLFSEIQTTLVREKDRLRFIYIDEGGKQIKSLFVRKLAIRLLSYLKPRNQIRNLFVRLIV